MTLVIRRSRSPFQIGVLVALGLLSFASAAFFDQLATYTARELPQPYGHIMYSGIGLAAVVALAGVLWRGPIYGLLIERIGLVSMACWTLCYGIAVLVNSGARGVQFGGYMSAVAIMAIARAWQIGREARELSLIQAASKKLAEESEDV